MDIGTAVTTHRMSSESHLNIDLICIDNTNISLAVTKGKAYKGDIIENLSADGTRVVSTSVVIVNDRGVQSRYEGQKFKTKEQLRQDKLEQLDVR